MNSEYLEVSLGSSFMLNAGICGFIRFLEHNNAQEYYKIKGQSLFISKEFLKNNDIGMMYIDTLAEAFEKNTGYHRMITSGICNEIENLDCQLKIVQKLFSYSAYTSQLR